MGLSRPSSLLLCQKESYGNQGAGSVCVANGCWKTDKAGASLVTETQFSALPLHIQPFCTATITASANWVIATKDPFALAVIWFLHIPNPKEGICKWNAGLIQVFHVVPANQAENIFCYPLSEWMAQQKSSLAVPVSLSCHEFLYPSLAYSNRERKKN